MNWIAGLDLATKRDYSALCFIHAMPQPAGPTRYAIHYIERLPHGISYPEQIEHVRLRVSDPQLQGCALAVDDTGVGAPVVDALRQANLPVSVWPITITGGTSVSYDEARCAYRVPKRNLVSNLSVLLENQRLKLVAGLKFENTLKTELRSFSSKITASGNEVFESWRDSDHDDCVLACAIALWLAENTGLAGSQEPKLGSRTPMAQAPDGVFLSDQQPANDPRFHGGKPKSGGGINWPSSW